MKEIELDAKVYRVLRHAAHGPLAETVIARDIETMAEAAEIALRLYKLQEQLGGDDEFFAAVD